MLGSSGSVGWTGHAAFHPHHRRRLKPFPFIPLARSSRCPRWGESGEQNREERHAAVEPRSRQPQPHLQIYHPVQRRLLRGRLEERHHVCVK